MRIIFGGFVFIISINIIANLSLDSNKIIYARGWRSVILKVMGIFPSPQGGRVMKERWFLVLRLLYVLFVFCVGGCERECEGQPCSSHDPWCCDNYIMEHVDGVSQISSDCEDKSCKKACIGWDCIVG